MLSAILLAAGSSRRMGSVNKLLLPWQGQPIVAATAAHLLAAGLEEVIVVTGHQAAAITAAVRDLPVRIVHNPNHEEGMTSSIKAGVRNTNGNGYMICLSDMVFITPEEYTLLKKAYEQQHALDPYAIGLPEFQGRKGNPVILPAALRLAILQHPEKEGCRGIVRAYPLHHFPIAMPSDHILRDIDRPEDYPVLRQ